MAYSTPLTATSNATFTAAQFNASVRDNILTIPDAKFTASGQIIVSTASGASAARTIDSTINAGSSTTTSASYAGLVAGTGPAVTVTTGTRALVFGSATVSNNSIGQKTYLSCAVSSATTIAATDSISQEFQVYGSNAEHRGTFVTLFKALNAGSNIFTMQYKVSAGTSTIQDRELIVIAL